jgi:hypothetical protein
MPRPCRAHAVPLPCHAALTHTCHTAPLPLSDNAVSFVKVRVVAGRSRTRAGRPHAVSGRPMLIHTCHAMTMPRPCRSVPWPSEVAFRTAWSWHGTGAAWARHGMCESNTVAMCKPNGKDTIYPLSARHGKVMGTALYV